MHLDAALGNDEDDYNNKDGGKQHLPPCDALGWPETVRQANLRKGRGAGTVS